MYHIALTPDESPFNALTFGAFDRYGWVSADAKGEEFQVREVV